jgi:hypothetical protein
LDFFVFVFFVGTGGGGVGRLFAILYVTSRIVSFRI